VRRIAISFGFLALALLSTLPAKAATLPIILSATAPGGRITVSWMLPPGHQSEWVEVAEAPSTDAYGFFSGSLVDFYSFTSPERSQTTWASSEIVPPGTYYVHVSVIASDYTSAWSSVASVNVTETKVAPEFSTLTQVGQRLKATWALSDGVVPSTIEVARTQTMGSDGSFADALDSDFLLDETSTSWMSGTLKPGTYYVHISGHNAACLLCPYESWSSVQTVKIKDAISPTVKAKRSRGKAGKKMQLIYYASDSAGKVKVTLEVFRKGHRIARFGLRYQNYDSSSDYYINWKAPPKAGALRLCASGVDQAGNHSKRSCAPLVITVPRPSSTGRTSSAGSTPSGATALCKDGTYSYSQHRQGTCSWHGGVAVWL
jgi:hypothetical protein